MRFISSNLILPCCLILLGIYLLAATGYDEFQGVTAKPYTLAGKRRGTTGHAYLYRIPVRRDQDPELFHQFMMGHWMWAVGIEGAGILLLLKNKL